jgi:hypothetical protein
VSAGTAYIKRGKPYSVACKKVFYFFLNRVVIFSNLSLSSQFLIYCFVFVFKSIGCDCLVRNETPCERQRASGQTADGANEISILLLNRCC